MIDLKIVKTTAPGGAAIWALEPEGILCLGGFGSNLAEQLRITLPEEWAGCTVRITFQPDGGDPIGVVLLEGNTVDITADMVSGRCGLGEFVLDGVCGERVMYTVGGRYSAYPHPKAGGAQPAPTPSEYRQIINAVEEGRLITGQALAARDEAAAARGEAVAARNEAVTARNEAVAARDAAVIAQAAAKTAVESAQAAAASEANARQSEETAQTAAQSVAGRVEQIDRNTAGLARTSHRVEALMKLNQGVTYGFVTEEGQAYSAQVLAGAVLGTVELVGGHAQDVDGALVSAAVACIRHGGVEMAIPDAVRQLPGYGWGVGTVYNAIQRTDTGWQYVQRVGGVDLGTAAWNGPVAGEYTHKVYYIPTRLLPDDINNKSTNFLLAGYKNAGLGGYSVVNAAGDKSVSLNQFTGAICISDDAITDFTQIGTFLYEMTQPVITDITHLMDGFVDCFPVEDNTVIFENEAGLSVPFGVRYICDLREVAQ